jgi:hypothetical protein
MRRKQHGGQPGSGTAQEAEFEFGVFYRTIEEYVDAFASQTGGAYTFPAVAHRLGRLLQASALRQQLGHTELVPEVRQNGAAAGRYRAIPQFEALHDDALGHRALNHRMSTAGRKRIAAAQRARWAKHRRGEVKRGKDGRKLASATHAWMRDPEYKEKLRKRMIKRWKDPAWRKKQVYALRKSAAGKNRVERSAQQKGYWARMTAEERSAEMLRRQKVAETKKNRSDAGAA